MLRKATSENLLYVSDIGTNEVDVYPYPSGSLVGKLSGFGSVAGLCANKAGDVFVVDEAGPVQMFAHGGTSPIRKLTTTGAPYGCAVDPTTGNLALTNLSSYLYGTIAIYPKANGTPSSTRIPASTRLSFAATIPTAISLSTAGTDRPPQFS